MNTFQILSPIPEVRYFLFPHKRNQDKVKVYRNYLGTIYTVCVVDGWHNPERITGNVAGQQAAEFIINLFPRLFLESSIPNYTERAQAIADIVNQKLLQCFPRYVSGVGTFIFRYNDKTVITTIGTITTMVLKENKWIKPKEFADNKLNWQTNESGSATFLGRGELEGNKKYSHRMATVVYGSSIPVLILTDGADDVINYQQIVTRNSQNDFIEKLLKEVMQNKKNQRDDISVLLAF